MCHLTLTTATAVALAVTGLTAAHAAELTGAEIQKLVSGKSMYLEATAAATAGVAGVAVLYYGVDGTAVLRNAKGAVLHGPWVIKDNTICIDWKEQPGNPCTIWDKQGDVITLILATTKQPRGKIQKIVDGNPENLK